MPLDKAAETQTGFQTVDPAKIQFWQTALDHYALFGIDDLEQARTYGAPQFVEQFGSFQITDPPLRRRAAVKIGFRGRKAASLCPDDRLIR